MKSGDLHVAVLSRFPSDHDTGTRMASRIVAPNPPRSSFIAPGTSSQPSATTTPPATTTSSSASPLPPDLEQKLSLLSSHRSVLGYLLIARAQHHPSIIRHSGVVFEGEQGRKYAAVVARIVQSVQSGLDELRREDDVVGLGSGEAEESESSADEIKFMRIRTKRHELMISPDDRYLLAVLHDPSS
ncbi:hypothetical protein BKA70DRAFT_1387078 [Coprinopsis sp. MPI-PUGE-AT-0042]|nr:hypothetical protein BKA70DRAFT_1387078 [Coprinopsis sp. MPI-PUGE-AT-0042]